MIARRLALASRLRVAPRLPLLARRTPLVFSRCALNSNGPDFDISDKDLAKVHDIVTKLNQNPEIREILREFQDLIVSKGFNPNLPPSFMEMMRLFSQKDVRELASKLKAKFDEAGIQISPEDMGLFMKLFKQ